MSVKGILGEMPKDEGTLPKFSKLRYGVDCCGCINMHGAQAAIRSLQRQLKAEKEGKVDGKIL